MGNDDQFQLAIEHFQAGQLLQAEAVCRQILGDAPDNADALHLLGVMALQQGDCEKAINLIGQAIKIEPARDDFHFNLGNALLANGQHEGAVVSYRQSLQISPERAEVWGNLGHVLQAQGRLDEALDSFRQALRIAPQYAELHCNFGNVLQVQGRLDEAVDCYRQALQIKPEYFEANYNLGNVLHALGRLEEAISSYRQSILIKPDHAEAYFNLGKALQAHGLLDEAVSSYRQALLVKPDSVEVLPHLGSALQAQGKLDESLAICQQAISIKPDYAEAHFGLGNILLAKGLLDEAISSYRQSILIKPDYIEAYCNLGIALQTQDRFEEAADSHRQALLIKPDYAGALYNLGNALQAQSKLDEASACYRKALSIKPPYAPAHGNLGLGNVLQAQGQLDDAVACFRQALLIDPDYAEAHSNLIFTLDMKVGIDTASLQVERQRWGDAYANGLYPYSSFSNNAEPERRLRIGYVSADLRAHSAAAVFGAMLVNADATTFDIFAYSNSKKEDDSTRLFQRGVTGWRKIFDLSDEAVAELIRQDQIDILVDLSGHSSGNRLKVFARKPAPIQITAWGYIGGTGMKEMDIFFADPVVVPPEERKHYAEEVRYLPCVISAFIPDEFPEVNDLPAMFSPVDRWQPPGLFKLLGKALAEAFKGGASGLPAKSGRKEATRRVTFGSFNRLPKISSEAIALWSEVLLKIPESRMVIKASGLEEPGTRNRLLRQFVQAGVAPERLTLLGGSPSYEHRAAYNLIDISLDPFPHGGGVTTLEGMMMGVPVVTLRWPTIPGRLTASILATLGLTDWIAETPAQYVEIAVQKSQNPTALAELRQQLRSRFLSSIIGDTQAYARAVEQEYRKLWREWCLKPEATRHRGNG